MDELLRVFLEVSCEGKVFISSQSHSHTALDRHPLFSTSDGLTPLESSNLRADAAKNQLGSCWEQLQRCLNPFPYIHSLEQSCFLLGG